MLVVDASSLCEVLLGGLRGAAVRDRLLDDPTTPRRTWSTSRCSASCAGSTCVAGWTVRCPAGARSHVELARERFGHRLLFERAWELRDQVRSYDAMYVALAEALDATLVTTDLRLARATGPRCPIVVPGSAAS